jgi:hypothetical protein
MTTPQDQTPTLTPTPPPPPTTADDVSAAVEHVTRALFGALAVTSEILTRGLARGLTPVPGGDDGRRAAAAAEAANTALALGWWATRTSTDVLGRALRRAEPALALALDPPLVPRRFVPRQVVRRMTRTWLRERPDAVRSFTSMSGNVSLTAAEVVGGLVPAEALVIRALHHLNLDAVAMAVLAEIDLDSLVTGALRELHVDDLLQQVIRDTDLDGALGAGLERLDLTAAVLDHIDLPLLVGEALARLDTTQLVLDNVDVVVLAQAVIDGVDLPRIVRESSGTVASETVDTIRLQSIEADRALSRLVDRLMMRADRGAR